MQSGDPIKAPASAPAGGTIEVTIQSGSTEVWISVPGQPYRQVTLPKSGKLSIAVPNTPGEFLEINVVHGNVVKGISIPIIAPSL